MNSNEADKAISYLRFTSALAGAEFSSSEEDKARSILLGEAEASSILAEFISENSLETVYRPVEDELSYYPDGSCLVNYFNITDRPELKRVENFFVNMRTAELLASPPDMRPSFTFLQTLHETLFSDIYPSAGMIRTASASSRNSSFCRPEYIEDNARMLFDKLAGENYLKGKADRDEFLDDLAYYMGELEVLHPFRDGNMRVIMLFTRRLIRDAGYEAAWESCDTDRMLEASVAAIDGDYPLLVDVLDQLLAKEE